MDSKYVLTISFSFSTYFHTWTPPPSMQEHKMREIPTTNKAKSELFSVLTINWLRSSEHHHSFLHRFPQIESKLRGSDGETERDPQTNSRLKDSSRWVFIYGNYMFFWKRVVSICIYRYIDGYGMVSFFTPEVGDSQGWTPPRWTCDSSSHNLIMGTLKMYPMD